jgi:hypothetical protein
MSEANHGALLPRNEVRTGTRKATARIGLSQFKRARQAEVSKMKSLMVFPL